MAHRLVLVRHAKTEARAPELDDRERALTKAGLRSCEAGLPRAMALVDVEDGEPLQVWSSPARRARQTAEVAARALGIGPDDIEVHDSLYAEDAGKFALEARRARGTVVAVGHNPMLEDLYRSLSGCSQPLDKCAAAGFSFDENGAPRLEWFVQGPDHHRWKTLVEVEKTLKRSWKRVRDARGAFLADPLDVETLHRYRISLRVARSLVQFLAPWLKRRQAARAEDALKLLARETSRLRELDVFAGEVASREERAADDGRLALEVELERNRSRADLRAALQSERDARRLAAVRKLLRHVPWKGAVEARGLLPADLSAHFSELAGGCREDLESCDFGDAEATHDLRKRSKRLRYVARELKALLGTEALDAGRGAKELQERLGEVCDARVNAGLAEEFGDECMAREQSERVSSLIGSL